MRSEPQFQNSCEVYVKGTSFRATVYGRTREEVLADRDYLSTFFMEPAVGHLPDNWDDLLVVTATRTIQLGLGSQWTRVPRRFDEYGEPA